MNRQLDFESPVKPELIESGESQDKQLKNALLLAYDRGFTDGRDKALKAIVELIDGVTFEVVQKSFLTERPRNDN